MDDRQTPEPKALVLTNIPRYPIKDIPEKPWSEKIVASRGPIRGGNPR